MIKMKVLTLLCLAPLLSQAQIYTPNAAVQGTSNNSNVGIGTSTPDASLHIKTGMGNLIVENSGIESAAITVQSGRFNRPALNVFKQAGTEYWNTGILYDENGNQRYSIGTSQALSSSKFTIQPNGNIGLGTNSPVNKLQFGDFLNTENMKIGMPGVYNFEQVLLGQYGNGAAALEFISHVGTLNSYGVRFYSSTDSGLNGLQIQTASPASSAQNLAYTTRLSIGVDGNVGIGTIAAAYKLDVLGTVRAREILVNMNGADFVFEDKHRLMPLTELESFIRKKKRLPQVASATEMKANGANLGDLNTKLLQKIEEMTLYIIAQDKRIGQLEQKMENRRPRKKNKYK